MALNSNVKLFVVGRDVYHANRKSDDSNEPRQAVVIEVLKGRLSIRYDSGEVVSVSPQDRRLSLTYEECASICRLLNRGM